MDTTIDMDTLPWIVIAMDTTIAVDITIAMDTTTAMDSYRGEFKVHCILASHILCCNY